MDTGKDKDGCGRSPDSPCKTLLYLLQQVNRTHLPPDKELRIITDKSLRIDQQTAVSTILFIVSRIKKKKILDSHLTEIVDIRR